MGRKTLIILNATLVSLSRREAKLVLHETVKSDKRFSEVAVIKAYISGSLPPQLSPMALSDIESISDFDSDH